jgi:hypothetical protein
MKKKEKEVIQNLVDREFALIVTMMRGFKKLDELITPEKTDEVFSELSEAIINLNAVNLQVRELLR